MNFFRTNFYFLICTLLFSQLAYSAEYIVKYKTERDLTSEASFLSKASGFSFLSQHKEGKLALFHIADEQKENALKALRENSSVEYVVENIRFQAFSPVETDDPRANQQWALEKVDAGAAWEYTTGTSSVVVAVIDTGIDWKHEDLKKNIWSNSEEVPGNGIDDDGNGYVDDVRGWDFFANDNDPMDETSSRNPGHGTHCAGIVSAKGNNGIGISGMAQDLTLMPIRFLGADGSGDLMQAAKAIDYATQNGAHVISASWGAAVGREQVGPILEAIERARDKGVVFVVAAANDGKSNDFTEVYPANAGFSNVISVAASGSEDEKPSWSNFGRASVDIAAPGLNILSTLPGNKYGELSGTSMATPLVSGLVGLILSHALALEKEIAPSEVKALLEATSTPTQIETASGGRVLASSVLKALTEDSFVLNPYAKTLVPEETLKLGALNGVGPFEFSVSDPELASVSEEGVLTAKGEGQFKLIVTDSLGTESVSDRFFIGKGEAPTNSCPFEQPQLCQVMCQINPSFPWCQ